ncbi:hypothetical protein JK359_33460 [Streptomyces actinomycinicus]|uniref:Uncharacterized protein n=1 Tax=Streptomyces actinomycinicus TaxID=1695166 RepID=A0A937JQL1_9ACTN|nr:hypothetical protein [Streptomyces actinomycinicus]MBL1086815.1 hypothetical protein [Streptomyces actinomycinicus]
MAVLTLAYRRTERVTGTGRVTLSRTGGGADFGAYALLYTTRPVDGEVEAIIAATRPEDTDPAWNLAEPHRYGPRTSETRPLMAWAAALNEAKANDRGNAYADRLAKALLTTAWSTRMVPPPGTVDLPLAAWEIETQHVVPLWHAGHTAVRIGRLITVTAKET